MFELVRVNSIIKFTALKKNIRFFLQATNSIFKTKLGCFKTPSFLHSLENTINEERNIKNTIRTIAVYSDVPEARELVQRLLLGLKKQDLDIILSQMNNIACFNVILTACEFHFGGEDTNRGMPSGIPRGAGYGL
jgi:hypothetical protein